jgi:hypothetical protein
MALLERAVRRRLGLRDRQPLTPLWRRLEAERDGAIDGPAWHRPCVIRDLRCQPGRLGRTRLWSGRRPGLWGISRLGELEHRPAGRLKGRRIGRRRLHIGCKSGPPGGPGVR